MLAKPYELTRPRVRAARRPARDRAMTPRTRRSTSLLLLAALAATLLLALGLPRLHFAPGMPLPFAGEDGVVLAGPGASAPVTLPIGDAVLVIAAAGLAILVGHALWRALRGVTWRELMRALIYRLAIVAALCGSVPAMLTLCSPRSAVEVEVESPEPKPVTEAPFAPLDSPPAPVVWITAAMLALAFAATAAWLLRRPPTTTGTELLAAVRLEAERARTALLTGGDTRDAIVACYERMSAALAEKQGIRRPESMTAREFEEMLGARGLPRPPVHELTRLFESVRYGNRSPTADEKARAIACLEPIIEYCRRPRQEG